MRLAAAVTLTLACCGGAIAQTAPDAALTQAAFAPVSPIDAPSTALLEREAYVPGAGPVRWSSGETTFNRSGASVDSVRVSVGGPLVTPGGLPINMDRAQFDAREYEVMLTRAWPQALRFGSGGYDIDLSPHAGVGMSSLGGAAEFGATLQLGKAERDDEVKRLNAMGVQDGASFGDRGRWYLFAAASGRAVGLNMLRGADGWSRAGWSTDPSSALIGDAHVGLGWRKGAAQASFGYIRREVKGRYMRFGQEARNDSLLAFSVSIKPGR